MNPVRSVVLLAAALMVAACTAESQSDTETESSQVTSTPAVSTTAPSARPTSGSSTVASTSSLPVSTTSLVQRDYYLRRCGTRIGTGYGAPGSDIPILHIGPIALLAMDFEWTADLSDFYYTPDADGGYPGIKYVLVVDGDASGPVSLQIIEEDRDTVGLVYDPDRNVPMTLGESDHTVKFEGCSGSDTQFNGGFIVTEPTCVDLVVIEEGAPALEKWTASIPFGVAPETCV